jgi:hypothetical protein
MAALYAFTDLTRPCNPRLPAPDTPVGVGNPGGIMPIERVSYPIKQSDLPAIAPLRKQLAQAEAEYDKLVDADRSMALKHVGTGAVALGAIGALVAAHQGHQIDGVGGLVLGAVAGALLGGVVGAIGGWITKGVRDDTEPKDDAQWNMWSLEDQLDDAVSLQKFGVARLNKAVDEPFRIFDHNKDDVIDIRANQPLATDERMASQKGGPARSREDVVLYDYQGMIYAIDGYSHGDKRLTRDEVASEVLDSARQTLYEEHGNDQEWLAHETQVLNLTTAYAHERTGH